MLRNEKKLKFYSWEVILLQQISVSTNDFFKKNVLALLVANNNLSCEFSDNLEAK